jgi:hypothetical protein
MPATSEKQRRLMAAALHGADFPKAKAIRKSMSPAQIKHYTVTRNTVDRIDTPRRRSGGTGAKGK